MARPSMPPYDFQIEPCPPVDQKPSLRPGYNKWKATPLPKFPVDASIINWKYITEGAHGQVRKITFTQKPQGKEQVACLKLFKPDWPDAFERERDAYALLLHRGVHRCIPKILFQGQLPQWKWNGQTGPKPKDEEDDEEDDEENETLVGGIVMEWFEGCQRVKFERMKVPMLQVLGQTLKRILDAGVAHRDIEERNILLVRDPQTATFRLVWIDFSEAWSGRKHMRDCVYDWARFRQIVKFETVRFV